MKVSSPPPSEKCKNYVGEPLHGLPAPLIKTPHQRRTIRLSREIYQDQNQFFSITICTYARLSATARRHRGSPLRMI